MEPDLIEIFRFAKTSKTMVTKLLDKLGNHSTVYSSWAYDVLKSGTVNFPLKIKKLGWNNKKQKLPIYMSRVPRRKFYSMYQNCSNQSFEVFFWHPLPALWRVQLLAMGLCSLQPWSDTTLVVQKFYTFNIQIHTLIVNRYY